VIEVDAGLITRIAEPVALRAELAATGDLLNLPPPATC